MQEVSWTHSKALGGPHRSYQPNTWQIWSKTCFGWTWTCSTAVHVSLYECNNAKAEAVHPMVITGKVKDVAII